MGIALWHAARSGIPRPTASLDASSPSCPIWKSPDGQLNTWLLPTPLLPTPPWEASSTVLSHTYWSRTRLTSPSMVGGSKVRSSGVKTPLFFFINCRGRDDMNRARTTDHKPFLPAPRGYSSAKGNHQDTSAKPSTTRKHGTQWRRIFKIILQARPAA
jgi:hypothetical protein